jgi:hypothetical protein
VADSLEAVGFENAAVGNYRLSPQSPYRSLGSPGADMDALARATAGAITGVWEDRKQ